MTGKCELKINFASGRNPVGDLERSSTVAEIGQNGIQFGSSRICDVGRRTDRRPGSTAALATDKAARGAQTDASALRGERAIENEIGAKSKHRTGVEFAIDQGNQHAGTVLSGLTQTRQEFLGAL